MKCYYIVIIVTITCVQCSHGTFADFLQHLPNKMEEAFIETWWVFQELSLSTVNKESLRYKRRMNYRNQYRPPCYKTKKLIPTDNLHTTETIVISRRAMVNIPVLSSPRSMYSYLMRNMPRSRK